MIRAVGLLKIMYWMSLRLEISEIQYYIIMKVKKILFLAAFGLFCLVGRVEAQQSGSLIVGETPQTGAFPLVADDVAANVAVVSDDIEVVKIAADAFASDVDLLTGLKPAVGDKPVSDRPNVIIGTVGASEILDEMDKAGLISVSEVAGKWETFCLKTTVYKNKPCLVIYGSDPRGTAYGVFELSRKMGVSPWYWFADVVPEHKDDIYVSAGGGVFGPPTVKYRGIFINDEDWGLQPWAAAHMDTDIKDIGPRTYERVFELLLRLKANYLWPAMHPCTKAFWYYKENPEVARKYDIVLGSSHCEPLLRNNVDEWVNNFYSEYGKASGDWNWKTNRNNIVQYWTDRVKESKNNDAIYTVGMRGIHDSSMPGYSTNAEKQQGLKDVIKTQRSILADNLGKPAEDVPQLFCPYKEALTLYRMGLDLADDISLLWPDDNFGYIRQLSSPEEQKRSGGGGVYYHFSYWGVPYDHLWLSSVSPSLTSYEMSKAYNLNCKNIWVFNVGDIKPAELEMQFALDFAWDVDKWTPEKAHEYCYYWAEEIFGKDLAERIASIKREYYRLAASGKPEHVHAIDYSRSEIEQRLADYEALADEAKAVELLVPARLRDAYFELVGYPCQAAASMNEKVLKARLSFVAASEGNREEALSFGQEALNAYQNIVSLSNRYNNDVAGGKWSGIMDYAPRGLKQFYEPVIASDMDINKDALPGAKGPDVVKIGAGNFTACGNDGGALTVLPGVGVADTSIAVLPFNMKSFTAKDIASAPYVEYTVQVRKGYNKFTLKCLPTFPLYTGLKIRYAISIDGQEATFHDLTMEAEKSPWSTNVVTGYSYGEDFYYSNSDKNVVVRVYLADPGVVISELDVCLPDENPYTAMMVNPGFEFKSEGVLNNGETTRGDVYGWKRVGEIVGNSYGLSCDAKGYEGASICWYNSTPMPDFFELSQTVEGLPAGEYVVRCKLGVFNEQVTNQRLFANNNAVYYGSRDDYDKNIVESENYTFAGLDFGAKNGSKGQLNDIAVRVFLTEGEPLTVGIRSSNMLADGTKATNNSGWFKVDDFRIELLRLLDHSGLVAELDSLIGAARNLYDSTDEGELDGQYPEDCRKAFRDAIEKAEDVRSADPMPDDKELVMACQNLKQAIADYEDGMVTFTSYIVNPNFEYKAEGELNDGTTVRGVPYGWSQTGEIIGNSFGINNDGINMSGKNCCWYYSKPMPDFFELFQEIEGLPAGKYAVKCRLAAFDGYMTNERIFANNNVQYFGREEDYAENLTPGEINSFAEWLPSNANVLKEMSVNVELKKGESLRLGVRSSNLRSDGTRAKDNSGWFKVDDFSLHYLGNDMLNLDEDKKYAQIVDKDSVCDVMLERTFEDVGKWYVFSVPFSIDAVQMAEYFSDVRKLEGVYVDKEGKCVMRFSDQQKSMEAAVPYIVKVKEPSVFLIFTNVLVENCRPEDKAVVVAGDNVELSMVGNFGKIDNLDDSYVLGGSDFEFADASASLKGFRAFVRILKPQEKVYENLYFDVDGVLASIDKVLSGDDIAGAIYKVDGSLVKNRTSDNEFLRTLPKGVYIVNGKKILK